MLAFLLGDPQVPLNKVTRNHTIRVVVHPWSGAEEAAAEAGRILAGR